MARIAKLIWAPPPSLVEGGAQTSGRRLNSSSAGSLFALIGAMLITMTSLLLSAGVICGPRTPQTILVAARHQGALGDHENMPLDERENRNENNSNNNQHSHQRGHRLEYRAHTSSDGGRHRRHHHQHHQHHHHYQQPYDEWESREGSAGALRPPNEADENKLGSTGGGLQQSLGGHHQHLGHRRAHCRNHQYRQHQHYKNKHNKHNQRHQRRGLLPEQFALPPPPRLNKRQALTEAIHELRILESQDGQLRAFADGTRPLTQEAAVDVGQRGASTGQQQQQQPRPLAPILRPRPGKDLHCHLKLMTNGRSWDDTRNNFELEALRPLDKRERELELEREHNREERSNVCLRDGQLALQIPPFMMNLYRQLAAETLHLNFSETVQMMPYKAEVMRSFRQPKLLVKTDQQLDWWWAVEGGDGEEEEEDGGGAAMSRPGRTKYPHGQHANHNSHNKRNFWSGRQGRAALSEFGETAIGRKHEQKWEKVGNVVVELSVFNGSDDKLDLEHAAENKWRDDEGDRPHASSAPPDSTYRAGHEAQPTPSPACDPKQRLLPASQRDEICFWFKLDAGLPNLISRTADGQQPQPPAPPPSSHGHGARERLVEAELHVFKLFPQQQRASLQTSGRRDNSGPPASGQTNRLPDSPKPRRHSTETTASAVTSAIIAPANNRTATGNLYHLRTNLLEVSLYQILPRKLERGEFPLRLLDIRRIDLNANGWETFYVKRAVEDWLREPRSNLGLVIRAKSMFDEPIPVGLIRFADAYDSLDQAAQSLETPSSSAPSGEAKGRAGRNFDLGHQPLLVIYTTRQEAATTGRDETSPSK